MPHQVGIWNKFLDALSDCFPEELIFRNPQKKKGTPFDLVSVVAQEVLVVPEILVGEPLYNSSHNAIKLKILAGGSKSNTFSTHSEYILQ